MERAKNNIYLCYNNRSSSVMKQPWESSSSSNEDDDRDDMIDDEFFYVDHEGMMMMAWPPRSYTCSFCKREFRSAQALGGHMNVHRRDRAQLRQLSQISPPNSSPNLTPNITPPLNLNLPPNPNYNNLIFFPPTPPPKPAFAAMKTQPPPLMAVKTPSPDLITKKQFECFRRKNNLASAVPNHNHGNLKKAPEIIRLDLEMKINHVADHGAIKEDLDLELRLGYN